MTDVGVGAAPRLAVAVESNRTSYPTPRAPTGSWSSPTTPSHRQPTLTVTAQPVLDETRRLATVTADGETAEVLQFDGDPGRRSPTA